MNVVASPSGADYRVLRMTPAAFGLADQTPVIQCFKKKAGAWVIHEPTTTELSSIIAAIELEPLDTWIWLES